MGFIENMKGGYELMDNVFNLPLAQKERQMKIEDIASQVGLRNAYTQEFMRKAADEARIRSAAASISPWTTEEVADLTVPKIASSDDLISGAPMQTQPQGTRQVQVRKSPLAYQEELARTVSNIDPLKGREMMKDVIAEQRLERTQQEKQVMDGFNALKLLKDLPDPKLRQEMVQKMSEVFPALKNVDATKWATTPSIQEIPLKNGATAVIGPDGKMGIVKPTEMKPTNMPPWYDSLGVQIMGSAYDTIEGKKQFADWIKTSDGQKAASAERIKLAKENATPFTSMIGQSGPGMAITFDARSNTFKQVPIPGGQMTDRVQQPLPEKAEDNLTGALDQFDLLNTIKANVKEAMSIPGVGTVGAFIKSKAGNQGMQDFMAAKNMLKVNAQTIIKGIPSNFDVQTFIKTIPSENDTPKEALTKIATAEKLLYNTVRTGLENHTKANRLIPPYLIERAQKYGIGTGSGTGEKPKEEKPIDYKVGGMYQGKKILGINKQTKQLNIEGLGIVPMP